MAAVAADDDEIHFPGLRDPVYFAFRAPEHQVLALRRNAETIGELGKVRPGLLVNLFLHGRQVHGNVASVGQAQGFDDVYRVQFGIEGGSDGDGGGRHLPRLLGKVDCQENASICGHAATPPEPPVTIHSKPGCAQDRNGAMVWIVIVLALALAFGPVLYLLPTRKDRRLAAMRLEARRQGLLVELKPVCKLDADASERVTAAGEKRSPLHSSVVYAMPVRSTLDWVRPWRLLRSQRRGWQFDAEFEAQPPPDLLPALGADLEDLPDDAVALEFAGGTLACYWLERFPADPGTVKALKITLTAIGERLVSMDAENRES